MKAFLVSFPGSLSRVFGAEQYLQCHWWVSVVVFTMLKTSLSSSTAGSFP